MWTWVCRRRWILTIFSLFKKVNSPPNPSSKGRTLCTLLEVSHRQSAKSWGVFQLFNFRLIWTWSTEPTPLHPTKPQNMRQIWVIAFSPHDHLEVLGACFQRQKSRLGLFCSSWPCSGFLGTVAQWGMGSGTCVPLPPWGVCAGGMPVTAPQTGPVSALSGLHSLKL